MTEKETLAILTNHVPPAAIDYSFQLWRQTPFLLKLSKKRESKVGDFTYRRTSTLQRITLNHDLNPYLFLITYIHEVAHLRAYLHYGNNHDPHGVEWKKMFQNLMEPMLHDHIFPEGILWLLADHMKNPKATSFADRNLTLALRAFDKNAALLTMVSDLPEGSIFKLQGRYFKKGKLRRTRFLCHELKSKRNYLVPAEATVTDVQLSLL